MTKKFFFPPEYISDLHSNQQVSLMWTFVLLFLYAAMCKGRHLPKVVDELHKGEAEK